jgi:hypothetical protein
MTKIPVSDYETLVCWLSWHTDEAFKTEVIGYGDNRLSPNQTVLCTDAELLRCALFGLIVGQKNMKDSHRLIERQYRSYFPQVALLYQFSLEVVLCLLIHKGLKPLVFNAYTMS